MSKIIVNADDFGLSKGVNCGIIAAFKNGIVRSTTIMAGMPEFENAIGLLRDCEGLGCGVHMTLSLGEPVLKTHKTIINEDGIFYRKITNELVEEKFNLDEVYEEFCAQIDKVINYGVKITHLDSHHNVHTLKSLKLVIEKIVRKYNLPIRGGFEETINYDNIVHLIPDFYDKNVTFDFFEKNIEEIKRYDIVDVMCHPAFIDNDLVQRTTYSYKRMDEYSILTSENTKKILDDNDISIVNYSAIGK